MSQNKPRKKFKGFKKVQLFLTVLVIICFIFLMQYQQYMNLIQSEMNKMSEFQDRLFEISVHIRAGQIYDDALQIIGEEILFFVDSIEPQSFLSGMIIEFDVDKPAMIEELYFFLSDLKDAYFQKLSIQRKLYNSLLWSLSIALTLNLIVIVLISVREFFQKKNKEYETDVNDKVLEIMEKDRSLISYELHDDLAQKLAQINQFFNNPDFEAESFELLKQYTRESIQQIRLVSNRLKTPSLNGLNIKESYEQLFSDYKILTGMNLHYQIIGMNGITIPDSQFIHIFRIIQELLNNASKHSCAEQVDISIIYSHPELIIKYKDNGIGYDYKGVRNAGLGLSSIEFRINMLGARITHMDTQKNGVCLIFKVPVKDEENTSC